MKRIYTRKLSFSLILFSLLGLSLMASKSLQAQVLQRQVLDNGSIVLKQDQPEAALVIFPGAYLDASRYEKLGATIVEQSAGKVAVVVADFFQNFANPLEAKSRVQIALDLLKAEGLDQVESRVFLAGHSQGGIMANDFPPQMNLAGLVLLGSYLPHTVALGKNMETYPKPVLTLGGELDGLTGINYLAREFNQAKALFQTTGNEFDKPVVILPSVNHMQFADQSFLAGDLNPAISLEKAHLSIAQVVIDFMSLHAEALSEDKDFAQARLHAAIALTQTLVAPYALAKQETEHLCGELQKVATPLADSDWNRIVLDEKIYTSKISAPVYIFDKSSSKSLGAGRYSLHLPVYIEQAPNLTDVSKDHYLSPEVIACKLRTQDKLALETKSTPTGDALNCADMNVWVIQKTLKALPIEPRQRLESRYGAISTWTLSSDATDKANTVQYGPFTIISEKKSTGQDWVAGSFKLSQQDAAWQLNTVELQTSSDVAIKLFAGANYCKVLAPERVIEWATLFGLK